MCSLIGAQISAIKKAEDRLFFKDAMQKIGLDVPKSALVNNLKDGLEFAGKIGFPGHHSSRRSRSAAPAAASPITAKS